jgi:hypothetical protein
MPNPIRTIAPIAIPLAALLCAAPALAAGPLQVEAKVLTEQKTRAADGTVRVALVPARRIVPGDRVTFRRARSFGRRQDLWAACQPARRRRQRHDARRDPRRCHPCPVAARASDHGRRAGPTRLRCRPAMIRTTVQ